MKGKVKWWNDSKGFGFVTSDNGKDMFVHYSYIQNEGIKTLIEGEDVTFDVERNEKGTRAINLFRLGQNESDKELLNQNPDNEFVAFTIFGDKIKMVSLTSDGTYKFLDGIQNLHNILYIASSETLALERAVDELESLINDQSSREKDFQDFFNQHQDFILNDEYKKAHPHITLTKVDGETLIPDFVLEPVNQSSLCDLLELKLPSVEIYVLKKNRMRFSAAVMEACAQLREYSRFFDEEQNRKIIQNNFGLTAYKPKMFVIIGRRGNINPIAVRSMESDLPNLYLKTYDDLVFRVKAKIEAMKKGKYHYE